MRDEILGRPVLFGPTDADEEVADHVHAALRMENLRVKLDAVKTTLGVLDRGERGILGRAHRFETGREFRDLVAVGIPDAQVARQALEELAGFADRQVAMTVFARLAV